MATLGRSIKMDTPSTTTKPEPPIADCRLNVRATIKVNQQMLDQAMQAFVDYLNNYDIVVCSMDYHTP
jgi:hypothetical protein